MPVPVGEAGTVDVTNLARQLFHGRPRTRKMKIIRQSRRELVIQALKEPKSNQVHAANSWASPAPPAQATREVRDSRAS